MPWARIQRATGVHAAVPATVQRSPTIAYRIESSRAAAASAPGATIARPFTFASTSTGRPSRAMSWAAFDGATVATSSRAEPARARRKALSAATRAGAMKPGRPESVACAATARIETASEATITAANASQTGRRARPRAASAAPAPRAPATAGVNDSR